MVADHFGHLRHITSILARVVDYGLHVEALWLLHSDACGCLALVCQ